MFTNEAKKTGTRSTVGENVGASSYRSPASSVVIDPCSLPVSLTLSARHRDILGRHNGSRETPLSGEESNASEKYRSPLTSKRDSCATVIIQRQWTLRMAACTRKLGLSATQCGKPPLFARPGVRKSRPSSGESRRDKQLSTLCYALSTLILIAFNSKQFKFTSNIPKIKETRKISILLYE